MRSATIDLARSRTRSKRRYDPTLSREGKLALLVLMIALGVMLLDTGITSARYGVLDSMTTTLTILAGSSLVMLVAMAAMYETFRPLYHRRIVRKYGRYGYRKL
jgi:phosphatidylglycerophosphate synthase